MQDRENKVMEHATKELIDQLLLEKIPWSGMFNHLIFSVLHKLPATLKALQVLLTMVDFAVFHELV